MSTTTLPTIPTSLLSEFGIELRSQLATQIDEMTSTLSTQEERRDSIYKLTKPIFKDLAKTSFDITSGNVTTVDNDLKSIQSDIVNALNLVESPTKREANLSRLIEEYTELRILRNFFITGSIMTLDDLKVSIDTHIISHHII